VTHFWLRFAAREKRRRFSNNIFDRREMLGHFWSFWISESLSKLVVFMNNNANFSSILPRPNAQNHFFCFGFFCFGFFCFGFPVLTEAQTQMPNFL
jgi:hypothetical protein